MNNLSRLLMSSALCAVCTMANAQQVNVSGVIKDATGETVIGASVMVKGTKTGTVTDFDGRFHVECTPGATLVISYIGYQTQEVKAADGMNVVLQEAANDLNEVVVTGYTTQRKADLTGAISVVSVDDIAKQNENNPIKALQGRVPGMNISADGSPSGTATVRIRGIGTLNNNDPLYIVDGIPTKAGMHELNGNDIESIQVLKDAASASIYGSRAANGVIIITTKKGKEGKIKVDFDGSIAVSTYAHKMKVLNAKEYGQVMWQAYVNDGMDPNTNGLGYRYDWGYNAQGTPMLNGISMKKYLDDAGTTPAADTDWFDETTRTGVIQQYNVSVSNGSDKGSSFFSLGYYKNLGIIKTSDFNRFSARMNTEYKLLKNKMLTVGEHFTLNRTSEVQAPGGFLQNVLQFNPSLPIYTEDGNYAGPVGGYPDRYNPVAVLERNKDNRYTYWRMFGDAYLNLNPFKDFNIRTTFGLDYSQKQQRFFTYPVTEGNVANNKNGVEAKQEHWTKWMWNAVATYNMELGKNRIDLMAGMELNRQDDIYFSGYKEGFSILNPDYMWPDAGTTNPQAYGGGSGYSLVSFFGKANYNYADKYMASFTIRRDGSSRFGKNNRYATFPSVSAGWRINQENFLKKASWIDDLKIRASWGQTGNQEIDNLARYTLYVSNYGVNENGGQSYGTSYDIAGTNGGSTLASGFKRNQIGNDNIKWETTTQTDLGFDFAFFRNTLYGNFDWYFKKTKDILVNMPGIAVMGEGSSQWINAGEIENRGFEFNIGYRNQTHFGLKYDVTANISSYRNKITALPTTVAANGTFGGNGVKSVIGHPMGAQVGYVADGIFKSQEEIDNHATQEGAGLGRIRWKDLTGDGKITEADQTWIYNPVPDFTYGFNIYLEYKNFDFTAFFQGVQGVDIISDLKKETDIWAGLNIGFLNKGKRLLDAWSATNPDSNVPALSLSDNNNEKRVSSYWVENGSYLKLRTIQFGYNFPQTIASKLAMQRLRMYVSAQNLFTIKSSSFTGVDPENPNYGYPIPLNITFGLNVTF
ncbi:TonB-dependent receptor [Segatella copri]|uniref:SusC/RagA family TonB-linked outer membrane protein n=1 Tax=Segatella copri TaxID=165179 RepID=UPI00294ACF7D|nr:TonB-dependent receptor [Segatella copri]WOF88251.1 TonB-dependent receptor [Segatella copri]WOF94412.1 TonB-dependent receptor [Segatella copri]